ncbi:MAG: asparaginyl-tRNA synthetase [Icmadophila ericetorum]|nr:asparaginyl-tRNA synthetase [Icmadophila ericetorum]
MIWRSLQHPSLWVYRDLASACPQAFRRRISRQSVASPSIASILALPRVIEGSSPRHVQVTGHVRTVRNQKHRSFVELGDGSTTASLQALLQPAQAASLGTGTAVTISGLWKPCPPGKEQTHELHAEDVKIVGVADPETYPIQKKYHSLEYLRTIPHLRLRTPFNALLARLRSECEFQITNFFHSHQFIRLHPPIITSSDCEGAGEVFTITYDKASKEKGGDQKGTLQKGHDFFRTPRYLTVSSQLHLEAFIHEHQRVWTLSPIFRAEKSDTPRHLSEFYMLEAELRCDDLKDVMDLVEVLIRSLAIFLQNSPLGYELIAIDHHTEATPNKRICSRAETIQRRWDGLKRTYWPRITYIEAIKLLKSAEASGEVKFVHRPSWEDGLHLEHERHIAAEVGLGSPVFVTNYPRSIKPFYMLPSENVETILPGTSPTVACFDLLLPELCEVVGGSLREHRLEPLLQTMQSYGLYNNTNTLDNHTDVTKQGRSMIPGSLDWYVDLRRYGSVPHGGFGLGFDRLLCYLADVDNVRDMVAWPRYHGKCDG